MARTCSNDNERFLINISDAPITAVPFTMACWVNPVNAGNAYHEMSIGDGTDDGWAILTFSDDLRANSVATGSQVIAQTTNNALKDGNWHHICGRFTSATLRECYVDGDAGNKGSNTSSNTPTSGDIDRIAIGDRVNGSFAQGLTGDVAECGVWNVALTELEIAILALGYSPLFVRPQNLVRYYPLYGNGNSEIELMNGKTMGLSAAQPPKANHPRIIYPAASFIVSVVAAVVAGGQTMGSLAGLGGLAGAGGIAGQGGGIAA